MQVRYTTPAQNHLADLLQALHHESPQAARLTLQRIDKTAGLLEVFPLLGHEVTGDGLPSGLRRIGVVDTRLFFVYRIDGAVIWIVGILHGAQDWP